MRQVEDQDFTKYAERGAYHWRATHGRNLVRRSPRLRARYQIAARLLNTRMQLDGKKGIDIGCGDGVWTFEAARYGADMIGLDASPDGVALARKEFDKRGQKARFIVGSCFDMPFDEDSRDFAGAIEVIEHLEEVPRFLEETYRVLRPGGWFVCTTPQRRPDQADHEVRDPFHVREYTATELGDELGAVFSEVAVYGAFPGWLEILYGRPTPLQPVNLGIRLLVKLVAGIYNPYLSCVREDPDRHWSQLIALGRKRQP